MTTSPLTRTARKLGQAISRRLPKPREDSGLTTLEWLLIVAAVAGLAALAVVVVTQVVDDTSEQIAGADARKTAAKLAGINITERAEADVPAAGMIANHTAKADEYEDDCNRLELVYGDADITVNWIFVPAGTDALSTNTYWTMQFDDPETEGCVVT